MTPKTIRILKVVGPFAVLLLGGLIAIAMILARPEVKTEPRSAPPPLVRVMTARQGNVQLTVETQGTVVPRTESNLVAEVSGRVLWVSPALAAGGFFDDGEVLLRIDDADYEAALMNARALVAQTELRVAREEEEAAIARRDWEELGSGVANPLTLREPQLAEARAALASARAQLAKAERDLANTRVRAPYEGRVRQQLVDVGQFVSRGQALATLYAVDAAEVRLPIPDADLAHLENLPLGRKVRAGANPGAPEEGPTVVLRGEFAGDTRQWYGRIVRTEGELDPKSRMVHVIAQVDDPYGRHAEVRGVPLVAGLFVHADILGRVAEEVFVLPRLAMRGRDRVYVVSDDGKLRFRTVEVVKTGRDHVIVGDGLEDGVLVCVSPLAAAVDGMSVRTVEEELPPELTSLLEVPTEIEVPTETP